MSRITTLFYPLLLPCVVFCGSVFADPQNTQGALNELTLQDLMNIEMVSSGKFKQELSEITAAAFVITAEDIKHSGATNLPQLLEMVPGLVVAQATSSSWAMGIRGFNSIFSNKMLVMIDGRSLFSPLFSGVFWARLDLYIPDIARIEVIRGVGSTVWGANAVNGVVNIITKSTLDNENAQLFVNMGTETKYEVGFRFGAQVADKSYARFYLKRKELNGLSYFDHQGNPDPSIDDSWSSTAIGGKWEHFAGRDSFVVSGDLITQPLTDLNLMTSRMAPDQIPLTDTSKNLSFQWQRQMFSDKAFTVAGQAQNSKRNSSYYQIDEQVLNLEFDTNYQWGDHQFLVGLGARKHTIEFNPGSAFVIRAPEGKAVAKSVILSGYLQDEWHLAARHSVILGAKFESHSHSREGTQFDYQADVWLPTLRYRFDLSENSRLWAAVSRTARIPSLSEHLIDIPLYTLEPGSPQNPFPWTFELITTSNMDFDKEKMRSFELGYRANVNSTNSIDLALYHNRYEDVRAFTNGTPICVNSGQPAPYCDLEDRVLIESQYENLGRVVIKGFEVSWLNRFSDTVSLSSQYSYSDQDIDPVEPNQGFEGAIYQSVQHQLGLTLNWAVNEQWRFRFSFKYQGASPARDNALGFDVNSVDALLIHSRMVDWVTEFIPSDDKKITLSVTNVLNQQGQRWIREFPDSIIGYSERRLNLNFEVKM